MLGDDREETQPLQQAQATTSLEASNSPALKQATVIEASGVLYAVDPPAFLNLPRKFLAQGDSWFSIGAMPPFLTTNLLMEMQFPQAAAIINCAHPGDTLSHMVKWKFNPVFTALLCGPQSYEWDALLLSAGGNDLIDAAATLPRHVDGSPVPPDCRLLLLPTEWMAVSAPDRYISPLGWQSFENYLKQQFEDLLDFLSHADPENKDIPVFVHCYDYPMPRNAPAATFPLKMGPWLYPAMVAYEIPETDWQDLGKRLIDKLANILLGQCQHCDQVHFVDTRAQLTPAWPGTTGQSNGWINEIHPTRSGYRKLSQVYAPKITEVVGP